MDQSNFVQLLEALRSSDNEARKAAEAQYEAVSQQQPTWMMSALAEFAASSQDPSAVTLVLILLRKLINVTHENADGTTVPMIMMADAQTQETIKARVLQVLGTAAFGPQRGSAAACVSALAASLDKSQQRWDELWNSVFSIITDTQSATELKTICCDIISTVSASMVRLFEENRGKVAQGMQMCLQQQGENTKMLREASMKAIVALVPLGFKQDFAPLVPSMLGCVQESLNAGDWDGAETLLITIVQGLSDSPQLFEPEAMALLSGLMQVAASTATPRSVRHAAVEGLLTFCEEMPKAARKVPQFVTSLFELLFQYSLAPEFADDWDVTRDLESEMNDDEDATDFLLACSGFDRLAGAIGGRKLKDTAQRLFAQGLQSPDWKHRHAALCMTTHITEGMQAAFEAHLASLVDAILPAVADEDKHVRAAALECFAQLSQDFAPNIQNTFHQKILPPIVNALRDSIPHVAASSAACIDSFFDFVSNDVEDDDDSLEVARMFAPYAAQVCNDCVVLLRGSSSVPVREAALGALSSLVSTLKSEMKPYTAELVPAFQEVLAQADTPEVMDSKCKAIECVTLLAAGVGKEVMGPHAQSICEFLQGLCQQGLKNDDPRFRFVLRGWTCMVECMKEDSLPYLNGVMPTLIDLMNLECDVIITEAPVGDADDDEANQAEEAAGVESVRLVIPGVGERIAKMHTGLIEDKELASNVVNAIMMELGTLLHPYFPQIARSAIKLLDFKVNDSIRESGALLLTSVMEGYGELQSPDSLGLASEALGPLLEALVEEPEADVGATLMECISRCIGSFPSIVTPQNVEMIGEKLSGTLSVMVDSRRNILAKKAKEQDEDEVDKLEDEDANLCENIQSTTELIGTLLERAGPVFGPVFSTHFFPLVAQWLQPSEDDFFVSRGLVIICDFVEHAPAQVAGVLPTLLSNAIAFANSRTDEALLQADFYLINNLTQYLANAGSSSDASAADFATQSYSAISAYLAAPQAATAEYLSTTANAVSAYVTLLQYFYEALGPATVTQMLQSLTTTMPCDEDDTEAKRVHDRVLAWITGHHPILQANAGAAEALLARIKAAKPENLSDSAKQQLAAM